MMDQVEAELEAFFSEAVASSQEQSPVLSDGVELWSALKQASRGGKRFRPQLVLATHQALGGRRDAAAVRLAAAAELLHTAFVIHDDVIDGDTVRRGRPNVTGYFLERARMRGLAEEQARGLASSAAILTGDLALTGAMHLAAMCGAPPALTRALLHRLNAAIRESAAGEMADVRLSTQERTPISDVLAMTQQKTAAYSFSLPLQWGALLAGAEAPTTATLGTVGAHLGLAFQLHDDLLGAFAPLEVTGKEAGCDVREGKYTALIAHARTTSYWRDLAPLIGRSDLDEAALQRARSLLTACGAGDVVAAMADIEIAHAQTLLKGLHLPPEYHEWLIGLPGQAHRVAA